MDHIRRYTLAQIKGYLKVIAKQDSDRLEAGAVQAVVAVGQAMGGG